MTAKKQMLSAQNGVETATIDERAKGPREEGYYDSNEVDKLLSRERAIPSLVSHAETSIIVLGGIAMTSDCKVNRQSSAKRCESDYSSEISINGL